MMSCLRGLFMCHTINEKGKRGLYGSQARKLIIIWILQKRSWFPVWRVPKIGDRWRSGGGLVESGGGSECGSGEGLVRVRWGFRWGFCEGPVRVWWGSCWGPVGDLERGSCARVRIKGPTRVWWGSGDEGLMTARWLLSDFSMTDAMILNTNPKKSIQTTLPSQT